MNEYKRKAIGDRLQLLDVLEALHFQAPHQEYYDEMLSDLGISTTFEAMTASLDELNRSGVARLTLPDGLTRWNFGDFPVRIKDIDLAKVKEMQHSLESELGDPADEDSTSSEEPGMVADVNSSQQRRQSGNAHDADNANGPAFFSAVIGVVGTVIGLVAVFWSWRVLHNNPDRALALVSTLMFGVVCTRIYLRAKSSELSWSVALDIATTVALCVCLTLTVVLAL
jgi:hypothetical protein